MSCSHVSVPALTLEQTQVSPTLSAPRSRFVMEDIQLGHGGDRGARVGLFSCEESGNLSTADA